MTDKELAKFWRMTCHKCGKRIAAWNKNERISGITCEGLRWCNRCFRSACEEELNGPTGGLAESRVIYDKNHKE